MAIATGTALVIAAGVGAAGAAANAKIQSNANKRALASSEKGTDAALAYQRESDTYERGLIERQYSDKKKRYDDWLARRPGGPGGAGAPAGVLTPAQYGATDGSSLSALIQQGQTGMQPAAPGAEVGAAPAGVVPAGNEGGTPLSQLARWSDHNQYFRA